MTEKQTATSSVLEMRRAMQKLQAANAPEVASPEPEKAAPPPKAKRASSIFRKDIVGLAKRMGGPQSMGLALSGAIVLGSFFGSLGYWSVTAPLASAAIAQGQVAIENNRKIVQHLEGGIVSEIHVREGQKVKAGDILFILDDTEPKANKALLNAKIAAAKEQVALLKDEIAGVADLYRQGYSSKPRLLGLQRQLAEAEGQIRQDEARLNANNDRFRRTELRAPVSGSVIDLDVHTIGGVIKPGDTLLSIVPSEERLVVEARVRPNDIDVVRKGLTANIRLTPFNARVLEPVHGVVETVSADALKDEATGQEYYTARLSMPEQKGNQIGPVTMSPGMPVEVSILTGERTVADYLLAPLVKSFSRAFKED